MSDTELKNRFEVLGHLKVNIDSIQACAYSKEKLNGLVDNFRILTSRLVDKSIQKEEDLRVFTRIGKHQNLWITITDSKVNALIVDSQKKTVTQTININKAFEIADIEERLVNFLEPKSLIPEFDNEKKEFLLTRLLEKQFQEDSPVRGSPAGKTCMGYDIDDDFDLS
jgi:hypothetical protein